MTLFRADVVKPFNHMLGSKTRAFFWKEVPISVRNADALQLAFDPLLPHSGHIVHTSQIARRVHDAHRYFDLFPSLLIFSLLIAIHASSSSVISTRAGDALGLAELVTVVLPGIILLKALYTFGVAAFDTLQIGMTPVLAAHLLDHRGCDFRGEERPVVVCRARLGVRKGTELLEGGHDVHQDRGDDVVRRVIVDDDAVTYAASAVVAAPDDFSRGTVDGLQGFDYQCADGPFVRLWR